MDKRSFRPPSPPILGYAKNGIARACNDCCNGPMSGPNRRRIFGDRVRGAEIHAQHTRQRALKAAREADAAECHLWSERMEGFGGPAQPSPTIAQCLNGGHCWLEVLFKRPRKPTRLPPGALLRPPHTP